MRRSHIWAMWFPLGCAMLKALQLFSWVVQYTRRGGFGPAKWAYQYFLIWMGCWSEWWTGSQVEHRHLRLIGWYLGCCNRGKLHFFPSRGTPGLPQGTPSHQILPARMPIRGKHFFPPDHTASLASHQLFSGGCPSVGNILFPPIIPLPTGLLGAPSHQLFSVGCLIMGNLPPAFRVPTYNPSLIYSLIYSLYVCTIYNKYIWFVKCAVLKNANKNTEKIWLNSLHISLSIPLKTAQFPE